MTGRFDREHLPDWVAYADEHGIELHGRGAWRTGPCVFHGGSDSMRVNTDTGGWICMSCGAKGGDTLAHYMQATGTTFVQAAQDLGAWVDDGTHQPVPSQPARLSARDALQVIGLELGVCVIVIADARRGLTPNESDWQRFLEAAGRVQFVAQEAAA